MSNKQPRWQRQKDWEFLNSEVSIRYLEYAFIKVHHRSHSWAAKIFWHDGLIDIYTKNELRIRIGFSHPAWLAIESIYEQDLWFHALLKFKQSEKE